MDAAEQLRSRAYFDIINKANVMVFAYSVWSEGGGEFCCHYILSAIIIMSLSDGSYLQNTGEIPIDFGQDFQHIKEVGYTLR